MRTGAATGLFFICLSRMLKQASIDAALGARFDQTLQPLHLRLLLLYHAPMRLVIVLSRVRNP